MEYLFGKGSRSTGYVLKSLHIKLKKASKKASKRSKESKILVGYLLS